jgi:hypothetical protein
MTFLNINKNFLLGMFFLFVFCLFSQLSAYENILTSTNTTNLSISTSTTKITELPDDLIKDQKMTMTSDILYRDTNAGKINAQGNVIAKFKDAVIYADDLEYYDGTGVAKTSGNVRIRDSKEYMRGEKLEYAVNVETGVIKNATSLSYPWIVKGQTIQKVSKDKTIIRKGKITSCDYENPDFYFKASKIVIYFKDKMIAYNVVLFIRGIPIVYLPIMRQSLKDLPVQIAVSLGQNTLDGWYEKIRIKYPFTRDESVTLYADHYDYRGWGLGLQYDYKKADIKNGSIYLYGIDDTLTDTNKRTFRLNHFQKLTPNLRSFTNINYQNDQSFNNDFLYTGSASALNGSGERVSGDIYSYSSLNYIKDLYSMLLVWQDNESWNNTKKGYYKTSEVLPSFSFATNTNKLSIKKIVQKHDFYGLGLNIDETWDDLIENGYIDKFGKITPKLISIGSASELKLKQQNISNKEKIYKIIKPRLNNLFYKYNFEFANNYDSANNNYYTTGNSAFSLTNSVKVNKDITLTPSVGIREVMSNSANINNNNIYEEKYSTRVDSILSLKDRFTRDIDLNLSYSYTTGLFAEDYIVDMNKLNVGLNAYFFNGKLKFNTYTGYDFDMITTRDVDRWDAISSDMRIKFNKYFNSYSRHTYSLSKNWTNVFQNILYFYPTAKLSLSENATFLSSIENSLDTITTIKYRPNLKWKFDYSYRCDYNYVKQDFSNIKSREFAIYRDLHCWEMKFSVLDKIDTDSSIYREYWIVFNLKAMPSQEISLYHDNKYYDKWYYWDVKSRT